MTRMRVLALGLGLGLAAFACTGGAGDPSTGGVTGNTTTTPEARATPEARVAPPATKLEVTATFVSATLGEDCQGAGRPQADEFCAPSQDGGICGTVCQQSNMQLSFKTGAGQAVKVEVIKVTLHDEATGNEVDALDAGAPQAWNGNAYAAWDGTLAPSSERKASYDLSAPEWSKVSAGNRFSAQYRMRVTLRIDGSVVTLESASLNREPQVAT